MNPEITRAAILRLIMDASEFIDAKKRLETISDYAFTADTLLDKFPSFTLEDFRICCDNVKAETHYERLKAGEFAKVFAAYDERKSEAAALRAQNIQRVEAQDRQRNVMRALSETMEVEEREASYADWIAGKRSVLTADQRKELQERDRARRDE